MFTHSALFTFVAGAALLFVPGLILTYLLRLRGLLALSVAPAVTFMAAGGLAVFYSKGGIPFTPATFFFGLVVMTVATMGFARLFRLPIIGRRLSSKTDRWIFGGTLVVAIIVSVLPMLVRFGLGQPIQQIDPAFHMNSVYLVEQTHAASSFGDFTRMWGVNTSATTMPAGWHALVSLFATESTIIQATNSMFVLDSAVWALGIAALASVTFPEKNWMPLAAIAASTLVVEYPTYMHSAYPALPNAATISVLPGLLAWTLLALFRRFRREVGQVSQRTVVGWILAISALVTALMLTHPSVGLNLTVLLLLPLISAWIGRAVTLAKEHRRKQFFVELGTAVIVFVSPLVSLLNGAVRQKVFLMLTSYNTYPNPSPWALIKTYTLWPIFTTDHAGAWEMRSQAVVQLAIVLLTTAGIIGIIIHARQQRLLLWALLSTMLLTLTTMIRMGPLVSLAGLWYMSSHRTMSIQAVPQIIVMAYGVGVLFGFVEWSYTKFKGVTGSDSFYRRFFLESRTLTFMALVLVVFGSVFSMPARANFINRVYDPSSDFKTNVASAEELEMIKSLKSEITDDGLVIGDPFNGSTLVQSYGVSEVLFPQLYFRASNTEELFLKDHFNEIMVNTEVCALLEELNVKYFYEDSDYFNYGADSRVAAPGLYDVDTSVGFTKIAEGGSATVYRIDVCENLGE
ncbi:MAG: hypothetical protein Q4E01_03855 [Actinomycetaceae bacterium]|nr:hypothetical protein [Actinomycetaceae bacterium]